MQPQKEKKKNALRARKRKLLSLTNEVTDLNRRLLEFGVKEMEPQRKKKRNALRARKRKLLSLTNEVTDLNRRLLEFGVKEGKTISGEGNNFLKDGTAEKEEEERGRPYQEKETIF
ncbi:hypothetical protein QE152_g26381 [Popillia japonica]|uniref:Uncharacterized protein n=1 Tax=Popillia japonica TaxID=7064 RepID=A0AAW1JZQ6_POPJA